MFLSDDAGYADFGFQGSDDFETPALDDLARRGVVFTNAYASSAVCSPSRAGLLTGKYPSRLGMEFNLPGDRSVGIPAESRGLPRGEMTLADRLGEIDRVTGFVGKWHLGSARGFHPLDRGYDFFYGILEGHAAYLAGTDRLVYDGHDPEDPGDLPYLTDAFGDVAVEFVERNRDRPFYLQVSFTAPHPPMQAPAEDRQRFSSRFSNSRRATNAAMVYRMDRNIAKVVDAIDGLGLADRTLFVFTNDNGGSPRSNGASNAPYSGAKGSLFEGGIRVPLLVSWTGYAPGGFRSDDPVSGIDIVPTALEAVSGSTSGLEVDGTSLLPALRGATVRDDATPLFWRVNWAAAIRVGRHKLIRTPGNDVLMFDLVEDPGEMDNILNGRPERVRNLLLLLGDWERTVGSPLWRAPLMWKSRVDAMYDR